MMIRLLVVCSFFMVAGVSGAVDPYSLCTGNTQLKHFVTFLVRVDNNTNQIMEYSDFNNTAGRLMSVSNYTKFSPTGMYGVNGVVQRAWDIFPKYPMKLSSFILVAALLSNDMKTLNDTGRGMCDVMFDAFDCRPLRDRVDGSDGDGSLNQEELGISWYTYGQENTTQLPTAFKDLDTDGNGAISQAEYIDHCICYFVTRDPNARCRWLLGPDDFAPTRLD